MSLRLTILLPCIWLHLLAAQAQDAIEWHPWSDEVFERAKRKTASCSSISPRCGATGATSWRTSPIAIRRWLSSSAGAMSPFMSIRIRGPIWPTAMKIMAGRRQLSSSRRRRNRQAAGLYSPTSDGLYASSDYRRPNPGPSVIPEEEILPGSSASLSPARVQELRTLLLEAYDPKNFGWGSIHKFLDWNLIEYCMAAAAGMSQRRRFRANGAGNAWSAAQSYRSGMGRSLSILD